VVNLFSLPAEGRYIFFNPEFSFLRLLKKSLFFYVKVDFSRKSIKNGYKPDGTRV